MARLVFKYGVGLVVLCVVISLISGMKSTDDQWEQFLNDDAEAKALAVNEGELRFLLSQPEKKPHLLHNKMTINPGSLDDGWIDMVQCHENLDKVFSAQILYHPRRTRNIGVVSSVGVGRAWVEKNSVQMTDIKVDAKVCVEAQVHSLYPNFDGTYSLHSGPFHRRFLDGYYPMRMTMDVELPKNRLSYGAIAPMEQAGFSVKHHENGMQVNALFVGELNIEVQFDSIDEG